MWRVETFAQYKVYASSVAIIFVDAFPLPGLGCRVSLLLRELWFRLFRPSLGIRFQPDSQLMVRLTKNRSRHVFSLVAATAATLSCAGCCCPSVWYDMQAQQTWNELQVSLNEGPPPNMQEKAGFTMQLPLFFTYAGDKAMNTLTRGAVINDTIVPNERLMPFLVINNGQERAFVELPSLKVTYEGTYGPQSQLIYCYVSTFEPGADQYNSAKSQVLGAVQASHPEAAWQQKQIGDETVDYIEVQGMQGFTRVVGKDEQMVDGVLMIYAVEKPEANVVVAYRAPSDIARQLNLQSAADASIATIDTTAPAVASPEGGADSGTFAEVPNTNFEMMPPAGFDPNVRINGFQNATTGATISVETRATPYESTLKTYDPAVLNRDGIQELARKTLQVNGQTRTNIMQKKGAEMTLLLIFGDQSQSVVVTGKPSDSENAQEIAAITKAMNTTRKKES